jgi:coenzyme Q-binding protein COQ10
MATVVSVTNALSKANFVKATDQRNMPSHEVHRLFGYTAEQLFDLVADVDRYPEFLPWWKEAKSRDRDGDIYYTDQVVGFGPIRERFCSKTVLKRPERIDVTSSDRPFRHFHLVWQFSPVSAKGCRVVLKADLEFRSRTLQDLFGWSLAGETRRIIAAFQSRAAQVYG